MKKRLIPLLSILYIFFSAPVIAAVTPGGEGAFEVSESSWGSALTRDGPSGVFFKGKWKASVLVGEPLKVVGMKWRVGSSVNYDGNTYSTDGSPEQCNYIPQSVINNIEIIDLEIVGTIPNPWTDEAFLFINADSMFKPGNDGNWSKTNLTLPASPDWKNFLYSSPYLTPLPWSSVSEGDAKNIMRDGFIMEDIAISKLSFNMTPVRLWLLKNKCDEEEKMQEAVTGSRYSLEEREQLNDEYDGPSVIDNIVDLWDQFTAEETDFESDVASVAEYREGLAQQDHEAEEIRSIELERIKSIGVEEQSHAKSKITNPIEYFGYGPSYSGKDYERDYRLIISICRGMVNLSPPRWDCDIPSHSNTERYYGGYVNSVFDSGEMLSADYDDVKYLFFSKIFYDRSSLDSERALMGENFSLSMNKYEVKNLVSGKKYQMKYLYSDTMFFKQFRFDTVQDAREARDWLIKVMMYKTNEAIEVLEIEPRLISTKTYE